MTTHIMLDLETWGKKPGCDIRSIGAVVFDPVAGYVAVPCSDESNDAKSFYIATENPGVDEIAGGKYRLYHDPETVQWWNDQSEEARAAFTNPVDLRDACEQFGIWFAGLPHGGDIKSVRIWTNGPQFDISILTAVYDAVGLSVPWHYRAPRDMRTITDAAGMTREEFSNYGDAHNALHDAIAQAMTVCEAYKRLGLNK